MTKKAGTPRDISRAAPRYARRSPRATPEAAARFLADGPVPC